LGDDNKQTDKKKQLSDRHGFSRRRCGWTSCGLTPEGNALERLLDGLTPAQREAVTHGEGPLLILAGPGSGKTRVITHRIAHLLAQGIPGERILALTFTNKAADEMRQRVERLVGQCGVWMGTFHRFCAQLVRRYARLVGLEENYTIYDTADSTRTVHYVLSRLGVDRQHVGVEAVASAISWAKSRLITPDLYRPQADELVGHVVRPAYVLYQKRLLECNAADFDDLLLHVATLLRTSPEIRRQLDDHYRFVLVDEYQDTNLAQYVIARSLSLDYPNLAVTGDPDQSIYAWRGADISNILEFEKDYPYVRVVRLEQNYRSTEQILRAAAQLIKHNVKRKPKALFTENGRGRPVRLTIYADGDQEAQGIARQIAEQVRSGRRRPRDFAVFYRLNALSLPLELALRHQRIPFQLLRAVEFFQRPEIKDVLAYLQLVNNPRDDLALQRVINTPPRGIGKTTLNHLADHAARRAISLLEAAVQADQVPGLGPRAVRALQRFTASFSTLAGAADAPVEELLGLVLSEIGYVSPLKNSASEAELERQANVEQLLTVARDFDQRHPYPRPLEAFLEEISLVSEADDWQPDSDRVSLMTLHASKGLEFPVVFLMAIEQGILPYQRGRRKDPEQIEEERRLMFVGITRAQEELHLSTAHYRDFRGRRQMTVPSPFLMELPRDEMEVVNLSGQSSPLVDPASRDADVSAEFAESGPSRRRRAPATARRAEADKRADPDTFYVGMEVSHPQYGPGRIVALSSEGPDRQAVVQFAPEVGRMRMVIAFSPLQPVHPPETPTGPCQEPATEEEAWPVRTEGDGPS